MATVYRTRTIIEKALIADDDGMEFEAHAAVAVARQADAWEPISDALVYEVHDDAPGGCTVVQLTGRAPKEVH